MGSFLAIVLITSNVAGALNMVGESGENLRRVDRNNLLTAFLVGSQPFPGFNLCFTIGGPAKPFYWAYLYGISVISHDLCWTVLILGCQISFLKQLPLD